MKRKRSSCKEKKPRTFEDAVRESGRVREESGIENIHHYQCRECGKWHIGKESKYGYRKNGERARPSRSNKWKIRRAKKRIRRSREMYEKKKHSLMVPFDYLPDWVQKKFLLGPSDEEHEYLGGGIYVRRAGTSTFELWSINSPISHIHLMRISPNGRDRDIAKGIHDAGSCERCGRVAYACVCREMETV